MRMPAPTPFLVTLLAALCLVAAPTPAAEPAKDPRAAVDARLLADRQALLEFFEPIPANIQDRDNPLFLLSVLKSSILPNLGWGRINPDGVITSVTGGNLRTCWVLGLVPGNPWLAKPGETLVTGKQDSLTAVTMRPDELSREWLPWFLAHELTHCYQQLYIPNREKAADEYLAYLAELTAADLATNERMARALVSAAAGLGIKTPEQWKAFSTREPQRLQQSCEAVDAALHLSASKSLPEREMRVGFCAVATQLLLGKLAQEPFEQRVEELNAYMKAVSKY